MSCAVASPTKRARCSPEEAAMAVRHIVSFKLKEDATEEQKQDMIKELRGMAEAEGLKDIIKAITVGEDLGIPHPAGPNAAVAAMVDFASQADYEAYAGHPAHQAVIANFIKPIMAPGSRNAIQFNI